MMISLFFVFLTGTAQNKAFTVVIDAGHGGKDPGAKGRTINEKQINLNVALKLGSLISQNHPDTKVIYTRKTDVFVELDERANIANRNKADLFISVHTNSVPKSSSSASGTETYTLGLARTDENLDVAMRENSAILLEDNYLQKYEGFDPNSSESYIIFEFMQNKHVEQSVSLASYIQKAFASANRTDRGVRQAGFLVLRKTSMPSVLIELGYISNAREEEFMRSDAGQTKLAKAIYNAFSKYKWAYDRKQGGLKNTVAAAPLQLDTSEEMPEPARDIAEPVRETFESTDEPPVGSEEYIMRKKAAKTSVSAQKTQKVQRTTKSKTVYKVQILTYNKKLSPNSKLFKGYKNVDFFVENGRYKYTYGESTSFEEIKQIRRKILKDFKDAFIIAFRNGERVNY
jgi:N-acetylmuramoyl-L-alanine amidase